MPDARVFVERIRRSNGTIEDATADSVIREGDVVAVVGAREVLVKVIGRGAQEVDDPELLNVPVEGVDVYVTNKAVDGKTLAELGTSRGARGVFLRKITRGATATDIPILPNTTIQRGDILDIVGRTQDTTAATKLLGVPIGRPTWPTSRSSGAVVVIGALIGALVWKVGGVPMTLSTAGGALISGLVFGWLRSTRPFFGRIPSSTVWFMNSVGLNVFIAIVGISAGPGFVNGLKTQGMSLFLWGIVATTVPLILGMFIGKYVFSFHDAILLGRSPARGRRRRRSAWSAIRPRARCRRSATRSPTRSATRCSRSWAWVMLMMNRLGNGRRRFRRHQWPWTREPQAVREAEPVRDQGLPGQGRKQDREGASIAYLNAGRGNPNWIATEPREAFFLLGQFAITESKRVMDLPPGVGGMPKAPGIAGAARGLARQARGHAGRGVPAGDGAVGGQEVQLRRRRVRPRAGGFDHRRQLPGARPHARAQRADRARVPAVGDVRNAAAEGTFDLYAVEGGTAAMCYIFKSLKTNRLLNPGDTIALGVPIFTPYLEMPHLEDYDLKFVDVHAKQENRFQFPDAELEKLLDPKIKAFFVVNPGNPVRGGAEPETIAKIGAVQEKRPDLILLTDDVYGTFVPGLPVAAGRASRRTPSASTRTASTSAARAGAWA